MIQRAPANSEAAAAPASRIGSLSAWITVVTLCIAQIISTIDRGMLALVIDPVRHDLAISEVQIALLQGFAFSIFYVSVGIPLGAIADVVNRRMLLIGGIIVWSAATIGGGLAHGFGGMFLSRIFIGIGEAVLGPCAVTIISDLFPSERRGRPMAVYVFGSMIAYGVGSLVSGLIVQAAGQGAFRASPMLMNLAPWRIAFVLVGAFGFVVALMLAFLREPARQSRSNEAADPTDFRGGLLVFWASKRVFLPLYGALAFFAMGGAAATGWGVVLLTRHFGLSIAEAGKGLGGAQIIWAAIGAGLAGLFVDRVARQYGAAGKIKLAGVVALLCIPSVIAVIAPSGVVATVLLAEVMLVSAVYGTTMLSVISEIAPTRTRGLAVALYAFAMTVVGGSIGPLAVAFLTEKVLQSPGAVGVSMAIVGVVALAASAAFSWVAAGQLQERR